MDRLPEAILVIDRSFRIRAMNACARSFHFGAGPSPAEAHCHELIHHKDSRCDDERAECPVAKVLAARKPVTVTHTHIGPDGQERIHEILASPLLDSQGEVAFVLECSRDVTDRHRREEERRSQSERAAELWRTQTIASLAAGVAREFNNLVTSVMGNAEMIQMSLPADGQEWQLAENVRRGAQEIADLTRQLLLFAAGADSEPRTLSLNRMLHQALPAARTRLSYLGALELDLQPSLWPVFCDPLEIHQVLLNLLGNAMEASGPGGRVAVQTGNETRPAPWKCPRGFPFPPGEYVQLGVESSGPGVPSGQETRLLEPFSFGRDLGRGLSLAAVAGFVRRNGGCVLVESPAAGGSRLVVLLPRACELSDPPGPPHSPESPR